MASPPSGSHIHRPGDGLAVAVQLAHEGLVGDPFASLQAVGQVRFQAVRIIPLVFFAAVFVGKRYREPRAQHRLGPQGVAQAPGGKAGRIEIGGLGQKRMKVPVLRWPTVPVTSSSCCLFPVGKPDEVFLAVAFDFHFQAG
jgi:hypothetical protein